jgi:alkyl hydroperoxide reductase subunit AhpF
MSVLDPATTAQLKAYLGNLRRPIELVASLDESAKSAELRSLVEEIAAQSDLVSARFDGDDARRPSFAIRAEGGKAEAVFAGLPLGHEFTWRCCTSAATLPRRTKNCSPRCARWRAISASKRSFRCRARTAPTWCRR